MKTISCPAFVLMSCCILCLVLSCEDEKPTDTSNPVTITGIYPNSNPVGGPVLIEGEGFTEETEIYFNQEKADIEERSPTFLTTKVPAGLGAATVTLRVENGTRNDEALFDVLSEFPSNLPGSPPFIVIPPGGLTSPISFTFSDIYIINVLNVYDTRHSFQIVIRILSEDPYDSNERILLDGTLYRSPVTFDGSPVYDFDRIFEDDPEVSNMEIIRSNSVPSDHPYSDDELSGRFITMENFEFPDEVLAFEGAKITDNFLLLTSNITGRQYLFVVLCYNSQEECPDE